VCSVDSKVVNSAAHSADCSAASMAVRLAA